MKTRLDELLAKYIQKDKAVLKNRPEPAVNSENLYKVELAQRAKLVRDSRPFKQSNLKVWNLTQTSEKSSTTKKQMINFPDILEFALKDSNKPKREKNNSDLKSNKESLLNQKNTQLSSNLNIGGMQMEDKNLTKSRSIKVKKTNSTSSTDTKNEVKEKRKQNVWALKTREERQKTIAKIINQINSISMLDLCKKYHDEIGVRWPESGKWNENPWKIVRNDCRELAKKKKIEIIKNEKGKSIVRAIQKTKLEQEELIKSVGKTKPTSDQNYPLKEEKVHPPNLPSPEILNEIKDINQSISSIHNEIERLKNEIIEIWKTLAKSQLK